MIHYAVVTGQPAAIEAVHPRLATCVRDTSLYPGEPHVWIGPARTWALAAIEARDATVATRVAVEGDAFVAFNGPALAVRGRQNTLATDALEACNRGGLPALMPVLGGTYNIVASAPAHGMHATGDFSGVFPLYWRAGDGFTVVSNRSTTVAAVAETSGWDTTALAWIIGHANLFDERMPAMGVSYVPPGSALTVELSTGRASVVSRGDEIWPMATDSGTRENLTNAEWDDVTAALVANFEALRGLDGPLRLGLTGGKDSRLCLALAKAAGLQGRVVAYTTGGPDSPEVVAARAVAEAAGFEHDTPAVTRPRRSGTRLADQPSAPREFDAERAWRRLREDVYRYEATVTAWSALGNPRVADRAPLTVKGFGGELYRRGNAKQFRNKDVHSLDALAARFIEYHQVHDPLGILRPEIASYQSEWLRSWVYETAKRVRLDVLPELFYVSFRLGHWSGPLLQCTPARVSINPLVTTLAARKNMELSLCARGAERFHFEVMRRAAPEVVALPFAGDRWADEIAMEAGLEVRRDAAPPKAIPKRQVTPGHGGWPLLDFQGRAMAALFKEADRHTDMGAICDMRRLRQVAKRAAELKRQAQVKELFSAVGVALALLGRAEPVRDAL